MLYKSYKNAATQSQARPYNTTQNIVSGRDLYNNEKRRGQEQISGGNTTKYLNYLQ